MPTTAPSAAREASMAVTGWNFSFSDGSIEARVDPVFVPNQTTTKNQ